ncbi:MAG: ABC transporter ATP-binding protein [Anaerolineales bacterium]
MSILIRFISAQRRYAWPLAALLLCLVGVTATSLVTPVIIQQVIDEGLNAQDATVLLRAALVIIGVGALRAVFAFFRRYLGEWLTNRSGYDLRNALYDKIQRLHFGFHDQMQTGQLMSRCTEDVSALSRFLGQSGVDLLNLVLLLAGIAVLLLNASPTLALLSATPLIVLIAVSIHLGRIVEPMFLRIDNALGAVSAAVQEFASGVQVVKAFTRHAYEVEKFARANGELYESRVTIVRTWGTYLPTMTVLVMAATTLVLWFGGNRVISGEMSAGELVAFNAYLLMLAGPTQQLGFAIGAFGEAVAGGRRIYEILDIAEEIQSLPDAPALPPVKGHVKFENVSFAYRGEKRALHAIDFEALPNQVIALIGPTGSGKTSLINLIPRFYDATTGRVLIDGHDVRGVALKSLRDQIGLVLQTSLLFSATLRENIAYGRPDADEDAVIAAAKAARAHDFILGFPEGYDTVVGERGVTLSGGQRQRVAIARALLMDPRLLILDDATSSVDTRTEHLIQQALNTLMQGRTTFVIAQRLSTVKRADLILVLDEGRIVQRGQHADLVQHPGLYQDIYNLQLRDQEQFQREMLFLDEPAEPMGETNGKPKAERPDTQAQPLRPSAVK